ncbi:MAG TPA: anti-sigma factor antagonist [Spirochaetia bacterium]|nr:anti-sigma factor antagonist [Spirochaetia bacterium]
MKTLPELGVIDRLRIRGQLVANAEDLIILYLAGDLDSYNCRNFDLEVDRIIDQGFTKILFSCRQLNYISSSGHGSLVGVLKRVRALGGDIVLAEIQPKPLEVIRLMGFEMFYPFSDSVQQGIEYLANRGGGSPDAFPRLVTCPICDKRLKVRKIGRFRCPECKTVLAFDETAAMQLA